MKNTSLSFLLLTTLCTPSLASAQERALLEVTLGAGIGDRSSTGVGDPLLGMGYDQSFGPQGALDVRLFVEDDEWAYVRHGMVARAAYTAGPSIGVEGAAFRDTIVDLGYGGRAAFPCMRRGDFSMHLGGYLAITGLVADADRGDRYRPNTDTQTAEAARTLDHAGLGGALGLSLDVHLASFVIGIGLDVHQWFGIDTLVARDLLLTSQLRIGGEIPIS